MMSLHAAGITLMALQGAIITVQMVLARGFQERGWPFYHWNAVGSGINFILVLVGLVASGVASPEDWQRKWVLLRGFIGVLAFVLISAGVLLGASPGDVAALSSINTVVAAILGRAFLGEAFRLVHVAAILCSIAGAVLISKPGFIFGYSDDQSTPWLGYACAVASGFAVATVFICTRWAGKISSWWMTLSTLGMACLIFGILPYTALTTDPPIHDVELSFVEMLPWMAMCILLSLLMVSFNSAASKFCPAAVSATVNTASRMVLGYAAQAVVFKMALSPVTLSGAALMLLGVTVMALARVKERAREGENEEADEEPVTPGSRKTAGESDRCSHAVPEDVDDTESLGTFIAAEFEPVACSRRSRRRRRSTPSHAAVVEPSAIAIGVIAVTA